MSRNFPCHLPFCGALLTLVLLIFPSHSLCQRHVRKAGADNPLNKVPVSFQLQSSPKEAQVSPGFTLYPVAINENIKLLNMAGKVVHEWPFRAHRARLLPNGNLLVLHATSLLPRDKNGKKQYLKIREYTWDGKVVWEHRPKSDPHHDLQRLPNGNTLILRKKVITYDVDKDKTPRRLRTDIVEEITPDHTVAWRWDADKTLDIFSCGPRDCNLSPAAEKWKTTNRDWSHTNTIVPLPENKWFTEGDTRFRPGNIMVMLRNMWTTFIIDHDTGESVWEYSGPKDAPMIAPHESHLIPADMPGAGNMLVFDNGGRQREYSRILEVNPVTKKVVWEYRDEKNFYSPAAGSVRRLPNGNTFISEDNGSRVFEVTHDGNIVWELKGSHPVNRAHRYEQDYCPQFATLPLS